jgi:hypothetical protein
METGLIIILVAIGIFYLRILQLRGRKRRLEKKAILDHMREANRKKGKVGPMPGKDPNTPPFKVTSWVLVVIAVGLMLVGVAARSSLSMPTLMETYWWAPTTLGILVFVFCFKVE